MRYNWFKMRNGEPVFSKVLRRGVAVDYILREILRLRRGVTVVDTQQGRRLVGWVTCLALSAGCSSLHERPSLYPNGVQRSPEVSRGFGLAGKTRAPLINLRIEPDSAATTVEGNTRTPRGTAD